MNFSATTTTLWITSFFLLSLQSIKLDAMQATKLDIAQEAQKQASFITAMVEAVAQSKWDAIPQLYKEAAEHRTKVMGTLEIDLLKEPTAKSYAAALKKLKQFAQVQLDNLATDLADELNKTEIQPLMAKSIADYIGQALSREKNLSKEQSEQLAKTAGAEATCMPDVKTYQTQMAFTTTWYRLLRQRLENLAHITSYTNYKEKYAQENLLPGNKQPIHTLEIDLKSETEILKDIEALEKTDLFRLGGELAQLVHAKFGVYLNDDEKEKRVKIDSDIKDAFSKLSIASLSDALTYLKGFQQNIRLLQLGGVFKAATTEQSIDLQKRKLFTAQYMYQSWQDFAEISTRAQTKDQLMFCLGKSLVEMALI